MSHFCVLVFHRKDESLEKVLQPWHEFECTGTDDEYVRDYDVTAEYREQWQDDTSTMYRGPDGELVSELVRDADPELVVSVVDCHI